MRDSANGGSHPKIEASEDWQNGGPNTNENKLMIIGGCRRAVASLPAQNGGLPFSRWHNSPTAMNSRFIKQTLLFAVIYYFLMLALGVVILILSHIPPGLMNLDWVILKIGVIREILGWPRPLLRRLWPAETTPAAVNLLATVMTCLIWGFALSGVKTLWTRAKK
jgi:hypothetical protein